MTTTPARLIVALTEVAITKPLPARIMNSAPMIAASTGNASSLTWIAMMTTFARMIYATSEIVFISWFAIQMTGMTARLTPVSMVFASILRETAMTAAPAPTILA